jgi:hypothetical protein
MAEKLELAIRNKTDKVSEELMVGPDSEADDDL